MQEAVPNEEQVIKKHFSLVSALLAMALGISFLVATPAGAATRNIDGWRSAEPCPDTTVCTHYRTWAEGARLVSYAGTSEFTIHAFASHSGTRGSEGAGQRVRNNAASMNNHIGRLVEMYYSPWFRGNSDYLSWGWAGNLYYTANDNASLLVPGLHN